MLPYPKSKDMTNRKLRKSQRNVIWLKNRKARRLLKKQQRAERRVQDDA